MEFLTGVYHTFTNAPLWLAVLGVVGAMRTLSHVTPFKWDDAIFDKLDEVFAKVWAVVKSLIPGGSK